MGTLQRIKQYIDFKGITNKEFEINIGFSNGAFASQLKRNRTIGVDKLENILSFYPELNPEWLLTGRGEMLRDVYNINQNIEGDGNYMAGKNISTKGSSEKKLKKTIELLKKDIKEKDTLIKKLIEQQQKLIDKL